MNKIFFKHIVGTLIFLCGLVGILFFINGYRYDPESGELFPTGILHVSSFPRSLLLLDQDIVGETPLMLRGIPIRQVHIRLEKGGYESYEKTISIDPNLLTKLENVFLWRENLEDFKKVWREEKDVFWDPKQRGFFWMVEKSAVLFVVDFSLLGVQVKTLPEEGGRIVYDEQGSQFVWTKEDTQMPLEEVVQEQIFSSETFFLLSEEGMLGEIFEDESPFSFSETQLFRTVQNGEKESIASFDTPIIKMERLEQKGLLLVCTTNALFGMREDGTGLKKISDREGEKILYSRVRDEVFWVENGQVKSFSFGE
jgi:hypothetical protein